ncbi:MAG: DNA repair protein RadC [Bacteroidetes bacterium]|nr:DNA repair protein RadC [Bacteroidota bacterium]
MENSLPIHLWKEEERPREKLLLKGKSSLKDAELLAILIGSGTTKQSAVDLCKQILEYVHQDLVQLGKLSIEDLSKFKGVGKAKAISIIAALELGRRRQAENLREIKTITSSKDIYNYLLSELSDLHYEEFWVVFLNHRNKIIGKEKLSSGGLTGTVVDLRILYKSALHRLATSTILVHNHPSGTLRPSQADIRLTRKVKDAGTLLDIQLLDHVIIADTGYYSFADEGLI